MLETTQSINLFLPMIFTIVVSVSVGNYFNKSIYNQACDMKQIPVLSENLPFQNLFVRAEEIMTTKIQTVAQVSSVKSLKNTLKHGFSSYPVVDNNGLLVGIISAKFVKILLQKKCFVGQAQLTFSQARGARKSTTFLSPQGDLVTSRVDDWDISDDDNKSDLNISRTSLGLQTTNRRNSDPRSSFNSYNIQSATIVKPKTFTWEQEPQTADKQLGWVDFKLTQKEVLIAEDEQENDGKMVDLRPYMVEMPLVVLTSDKISKVSNLFRHMQLKMLPVMAVERNGQIVGVITRQNLF